MQAVKHIDKDTFTQSIFDLDDSVGKGVRESHRLSLWPLVRCNIVAPPWVSGRITYIEYIHKCYSTPSLEKLQDQSYDP